MSSDLAPAQPIAYTNLGSYPWWIYQLLKPIGWPMFLTSLGACLALLYAVSVPEFYFIFLIFTPWLWIALALYWMVRLLLRFILIRAVKDPTLRFWQQGWRWVIPPILAGLTLLICVAEVPFHLSFALSRPAMERLALEVTTTPPPYCDRHVGLYSATEITSIPDGMRFIVRGSGFISRGGFAWSPHPPIDAWPCKYSHYSGNWYLVLEDSF